MAKAQARKKENGAHGDAGTTACSGFKNVS